MTGGAGNPGRNTPSPLILFDGVCNLCSWSVQFLAPRDRGKVLWFAPMQSASGQAVLAERSIPGTDWESFVLVEDGRAYVKSEAFFRTLRFMTYPGRSCGSVRSCRGALPIGSTTVSRESLCRLRQEIRLHDSQS